MRSRDTRALAELALTDLAAALGERAGELTIIGGLNADLLTDAEDAPHVGTVDVDILLQLGLVYERDEVDFGWLEAGLVAAGFAPRPSGVGWRWWRTSDGYPVKVELICDVYDHPEQEIALPGCTRASAQNLRGPAAALTAPVVRSWDGPVTSTRSDRGWQPSSSSSSSTRSRSRPPAMRIQL